MVFSLIHEINLVFKNCKTFQSPVDDPYGIIAQSFGYEIVFVKT